MGESAADFDPNVAVFLVTGAKIADTPDDSFAANQRGLWGTSSTDSLYQANNVDVCGNSINALVHTDATRDGFASTSALGNPDIFGVIYGTTLASVDVWVRQGSGARILPLRLYAISETLTVPPHGVVPEPATFALWSVPALCGFAHRGRRQPVF